MLTTITPYWGRPEMLATWLKAIKGATTEGVEHLLLFVGEDPPVISDPPAGLRMVKMPRLEPFSIGHAHNYGARLANTEWIMKIDIDTLPSLMFFRELKDVLQTAGKREWFNCGMLYVKQVFSKQFLTEEKMPIGTFAAGMMTQNMRLYSSMGYCLPGATNFICRTQDYMDLGGCDESFDGYGWEDYQQIWMLERYQRAKDPLEGAITMENVTRRCRDEISRRKAAELFQRNKTFCLFHHWHRNSPKIPAKMNANRQVLLNYIVNRRKS